MSKKPKTPEGAPEHICDGLARVVEQGQYANTEFKRRLAKKVVAGEMDRGEAHRQALELGDPGAEMMEYCGAHCGSGRCAMDGFGIELVGADPKALSESDREKLDFFITVDTTRACAEMAAGIFLG